MHYNFYLVCLVYFLATSCHGQNGSTHPSKYGEQDIYEVTLANNEMYGIWKFESEIFVGDIFILEPGRLVRYTYSETEKKMVARLYKNFTQVGDCVFYPEGNTCQYLGTFLKGRFVCKYNNGSFKEYKKVEKADLTKEEMAIFSARADTVSKYNANQAVNYTYYVCNAANTPAQEYVPTKEDSLFMPVFNDKSDYYAMWGKRKPQDSKPRGNGLQNDTTIYFNTDSTCHAFIGFVTNDDEIDFLFKVHLSDNACIVKYNLLLFDRWGKEIAQTADQTKTWYAYTLSKNIAWVLNYTDARGNQKTASGKLHCVSC